MDDTAGMGSGADEATGRRTPGSWWRRARGNGVWWVLPVLVGNVVAAGALPSVYADDTGVPAWLLAAEWVSRIVVFAGPLLMTVRVRTPTGRAGLGLYVAGLSAYVASWVLLVAGGGGYVEDHPVVALAPYWTPGVFLAGLGLMAGAWWYLGAVAAFTLAHTWHGLVVLGLA